MHTHNQCTGGQCSVGTMEGYHGHQGGCSCGAGSCSCGCCGDMEKDKMDELMETVKWAKESLLEEKIKAKLEVKMGKKLDKLADVAIEMFMNKWKMKHEKYAMKEAMMVKMESIMSEGQ